MSALHEADKLPTLEQRPKGFDGLSFAFHDQSNRAYWTWADPAHMPPVRFKEIEALMLMIDAGQSRTGLLSLADAIIQQANVVVQSSGKKKDDAAVNIAVLAKELTFRHREIIPEDVYFGLASVCVVRGDENPKALDRPMHMEKIATFREAASAGASFFTSCQPFRSLLNTAVTTESALMELRIGWMQQNARLSAVLDATSSAR